MASRTFLLALVCVFAVVVDVSAQEETTYRWVEVSAAVGGSVGGMVLLMGAVFFAYDFAFRDYQNGKAGEYCRLDEEVAAGNSTKL